MSLFRRSAVPSGERTPGTPDKCEWTFCREPGAGEMRGHLSGRPGRLPWTLCEGHLKPEMQPPDLRDKLVYWP